MSSQPQPDDICLECHWEAFHIDGKQSKDRPSNNNQAQGICADAHRSSLTHCEVDEACCDVDDCPLDCASICDGFVDCEASTTCSVAHCDDNDCEKTGPVCFDQHCCDGNEGTDCGFESLMGLNVPMLPGNFDSLSCTTTTAQAVGHPAKMTQHNMHGTVEPSYQNDFLSSYQAHTAQCNSEVSNHFDCHDFQKDLQGMFTNSAFPLETEVNPTNIFHMLGMCPEFSPCHNQHVSGQNNCTDHLERSKDDTTSSTFNCFHPEHSHTHEYAKDPHDLNLQTFMRGPHRNQHRCRAHTPHSQPYSPCSRHSRSSVSSHLLSSPGDTPPPLEVGTSSVLTTPGFSAEDSDLHTCKWSVNVRGAKTVCGSIFVDASALQEHLVSSHMTTINGTKGPGYYCCWEGCHRPDEPFSQKSKLQGHFLTHSNCTGLSCRLLEEFR